MKIKRIEAIPVSLLVRGLGGKVTYAGQVWTSQEIVLVRVETDADLVGYGEAYSIIPGLRRALVAVIEDMIAPIVVGTDWADIAVIVGNVQKQLHAFGRYGLTMAAISGLDIALWDIAGKAAGQPLWRLIGGGKPALPSATSIARTGDPVWLARKVEQALRESYKSIKIHESDIDCMRAARASAGGDTRLAIDVNCAWDMTQATEMFPRIATLNPHFVEDPLWPPENIEGLAQLRRRHGLRTATGGTSCTVWEFKRIVQAEAADFCQPSVTVVGGVSEVVRIAPVVATANAGLSLHTPYFGPGLLASLHLAAALGVANDFERPFYTLAADLYGNRFDAKRGMTPVPDGPGLGADPLPEIIKRFRG